MAKIGIIMGSKSDFNVMKEAMEVLDQFGVLYESDIVSAHRTPDYLYTYAKKAKEKGIDIIIAGAGGSAHLPGMVASLCDLPVIGVPIKTSNLDGLDSLFSIVQMPYGIPVGTMAINGSKNAALFALRILGISQHDLLVKMKDFMEKQRDDVLLHKEVLTK